MTLVVTTKRGVVMNQKSNRVARGMPFAWTACAIAAALLVACGGGGGASNSVDDPEVQAEADLATLDSEAKVDFGAGPVASTGTLRERKQEMEAALGLPSHKVPANGGAQAKTMGVFGEAFTWPIIPIHMSMLPDGRVMAFGTDETGSPRGSALKYAVWDPADAANPFQVLPNSTTTQLFCATQVLGKDGQVMVFGGTKLIDGFGGNGSAGFTKFNPATDTVSKLTPMKYERWYGSSVTLGNGDVAVMGGRIIGPGDSENGPGTYATVPEVYNSSTGWRTLSGVTDKMAYGFQAGKGSNWNYPRAWLAPNGKVVSFGDDGVIYSLDVAGTGAVTALTQKINRRAVARFGAMYAPGKLILGRYANTVQSVDLNGATPVVKNEAPLSVPRMYGSGTLLADGKMWVSGGSKTGNVESGAVYTSELWDPETSAWKITASAKKMRMYHSNALLMPDATVLTGGGGSPGPVRNFNAEIYYPPYLFNADGTFAARPSIVSVSASTMNWGQAFSIKVGSGHTISKVNLIRMGTATHTFNNEQRRLPLTFTQSGDQLTTAMPTSLNNAPAGYYMIFVIGESGVPSVAKIVKLGV
jgi:Domain of unknown function (DUF1929)